MSKSKYIWNSEKSVLSYKGSTLRKGNEIPDDFPGKSLKKLIKSGKVVEKVDAVDKIALKKLTDKLSGQKTGLEKAKKALSELADNATDAVKKKASKKVTDFETKISETETEIVNLTGGE